MKIKNISLVFALVCFLLLFSLPGYGLSKSSKNIEIYANPDIDYNSYRYLKNRDTSYFLLFSEGKIKTSPTTHSRFQWFIYIL
jgi:hypothetical protein